MLDKIMELLLYLIVVVLVLLNQTTCYGCPTKCRCTSTETYCLYKEITTEELMEIAPSIPATTKKLYLQGNKVTRFPTENFKHLNELSYLSLSFNHVQNMPEKIAENLPMLKILYLTNNKIKSVTAKELLGYQGIEVLNLDQNMIEELEDFSFSRLINLKELLLGQNKIRAVTQNTFHGLGNLIKLQLNNNELKDLNEKTFKATPNLQEIYLHVNLLSVIQRELFAGLQELRTLYLNDNFIGEIEDGAFNGLRIDTIYLNMNLLTRLPTKLFQNTVVTGKVYLRDNQFHCDCTLAWLVSHELKDLVRDDKLHLGECSLPLNVKRRPVKSVTFEALNCTLCDVVSCPEGTSCSLNSTTKNYTCNSHAGNLVETSPGKQTLNGESDNSTYIFTAVTSLCVIAFIGALIGLFIYMRNRRRRKAFEVNNHIYEKVEPEKNPKLTGLTSKNSFNIVVHTPVKMKQYFV